MTTQDRKLTTAPIGANAAEWVRPADVQRLFGMSRATAYRLIAKGRIKSTVLRVEGNVSGMRLISAQSIRELLTGDAI